jgi:hypothetical protein
MIETADSQLGGTGGFKAKWDSDRLSNWKRRENKRQHAALLEKLHGEGTSTALAAEESDTGVTIDIGMMTLLEEICTEAEAIKKKPCRVLEYGMGSRAFVRRLSRKGRFVMALDPYISAPSNPEGKEDEEGSPTTIFQQERIGGPVISNLNPLEYSRIEYPSLVAGDMGGGFDLIFSVRSLEYTQEDRRGDVAAFLLSACAERQPAIGGIGARVVVSVGSDAQAGPGYAERRADLTRAWQRHLVSAGFSHNLAATEAAKGAIDRVNRGRDNHRHVRSVMLFDRT